MRLFIVLFIMALASVADAAPDAPHVAARAWHAFVSSFEFMIVVLCAAIPWIALFLFFSWLALRFLRWWIRKKREAKNKNSKP